MVLALVWMLLGDEEELAKLLSEKDDAVRARNEAAILARGSEALPALDSIALKGEDTIRGRASALKGRIAENGAEAGLSERERLHRVRVYLYPSSCLCCESRLRGLEAAARRLSDMGDVLAVHAGRARLPPRREGEAYVLSVFVRQGAPVVLRPIARILGETLRHGGVGAGDAALPASIFAEADVLVEAWGAAQARFVETPAGQRFPTSDPDARGSARVLLRLRGFDREPGGKPPIPRPRS